MDLVEEVRFSAVFAFTYSPRPGTAAPRLGNAVDSGVASERLQRLFSVQETIQGEINASMVGREMEVIVTGWGKQPGTQVGRTSCHRVITFETGPEPVSLGGVTRIEVGEAFAYGLRGRRLDVPATASAS
jgi:tRNA-2-methylthio-N6-dimethylallyladenosine synthase